MQLVKVRVRIIGTVFPARWNVDTACDELKAFHVTILPRGRSIQTCRAVTSTARPVQVGSWVWVETRFLGCAGVVKCERSLL